MIGILLWSNAEGQIHDLAGWHGNSLALVLHIGHHWCTWLGQESYDLVPHGWTGARVFFTWMLPLGLFLTK